VLSPVLTPVLSFLSSYPVSMMNVLLCKKCSCMNSFSLISS